MNGIALHGGVIPACGTFFVFSDYMKPAVRLAALMRLHVVYVWTHDSFRVGEDGPTHQPIEHEAQIRLMEHLRNHHGERSMVVLRPVEGAELLAKEGIAVRVVNVPSEGLFRDQPKSYQESVLPVGIARYGLTSGLHVNLLGLVGENGMIHGLDHFGFSAPYKVLDEKFGFNGETVAAEVKKLLKK